jgi:hypothetical protein
MSASVIAGLNVLQQKDHWARLALFLNTVQAQRRERASANGFWQ